MTLLCTPQAPAEPYAMPVILDMEARAELIDDWLEDRVQNVLPALMRREGIDLWLIIGREYNEDPVLKTMLPATWLSARRRTMLLIHDPGSDQPLETLAVARYNVGNVFSQAWDPEEEPDQWRRLADLIKERDPAQIGINLSEDFALADGLPHTEHRLLVDALAPDYAARLVSAEALAIGWLETRTPREMVVYQQICAIAHRIIAEGFSEAVIQPGVTTVSDVQWWYRERVRGLKLTSWFHPTVAIQRPDATDTPPTVIRPGDLLHVDFGITYLRLNTDTQQHAYVLKPGETMAPEALRKALASGNRLQDILTANFISGRTGNEILAAARAQALDEGINPSIYTHPIGYHGHAAGPTIGLWDQQDGVPGKGDYPLYPNTAHSIELAAILELPGWSGPMRIKLEEDAFFDGKSVRYIDGRQTVLHLIPRQ
ncbi:MAG: aminopeptidase P family protein [Gammaproteobacteria bacterium]|nr:MAG: aminopeptidase P family protein [Gammaproteobacteria bacterium]